MKNYQPILYFWFEELSENEWFKQSDNVDNIIYERFRPIHQAVAEGEHEEWLSTPEGSLAYVIVLDQFSRNLFRGNAMSFAQDEKALVAARISVDREFDQKLPETKRAFLYMPYMHSEDPKMHEESVELFSSLKDLGYLKYEYLHKKIIDRFGRYPHRNEVLGRESTEEEKDFLKNEPNSSF